MDYTPRAQKLVDFLLESPTEDDLVSTVLKNLPNRNFKWSELERGLIVGQKVPSDVAKRVVQKAREHRRATRFPK